MRIPSGMGARLKEYLKEEFGDLDPGVWVEFSVHFAMNEDGSVEIDNWDAVKISTPYNPGFGDERLCECGHSYYRHFDTYEDMEPVGCKYCTYDECGAFKEAAGSVRVL